MLKRVTILIIVTAIVMSMTASLNAEGENILFNPSFELLKDGAPVNWVAEAWNKDAGATTFEVQTDNPQEGERYVTITNNVTNDSRYIQSVMVEENKKYKISCYIKAENVSNEGKGANLSIGSQLTTSKEIKGTTNGWEYVELYTLIGKGIKTINVTVGVGGYSATSTGKASFDDVKMVEVDEIPADANFTEIKPIDNGSNNNSNNNNNNNNANNNNGQKTEDKGGLSKIVWIVLILAVIVVAVATLNTFRSGKKPPSDSSSEDSDEDEDEFDEVDDTENDSEEDTDSSDDSSENSFDEDTDSSDQSADNESDDNKLD